MDHQRFSSFMKFTLPALAGAALIAMFLNAREIPTNANAVFLNKRQSDVANHREAIEPQYQSLNGSKERVEIRAQSTFLQRQNDKEIEAIAPNILISHNDQTTTHGGADRGSFEQNFDLLVLTGDAWFEKTDGFSLRSEELYYDLVQNSVFTKTKFQGTFPQGQIRSNKMNMRLPSQDDSFTAHFEGDVWLVFEPAKKKVTQ